MEPGPGRRVFTETALRGARGHVVAARYVYAPGTVFPDHASTASTRSMPCGRPFPLIIGGHVVVLRAGEWVSVPAGVVHSAASLATSR